MWIFKEYYLTVEGFIGRNEKFFFLFLCVCVGGGGEGVGFGSAIQFFFVLSAIKSLFIFANYKAKQCLSISWLW